MCNASKYLSLDVPSNHRWNECGTRRLEVGNKACYAIMDIHFRHFSLTGASIWGGNMGWKYGVVLGSIPKSTWKEFENVQRHFLTKFLQVKKQTSYTLLDMGSIPIEIIAMERVVEYMLKVQKSVSHQLPRIVWEARKKSQKMHKSKKNCFGWMQDIEKWFGSGMQHTCYLMHH